ncbi:hypothetical protein [Zavarzinella formosa]|uniref:hypothetical protein n=1 Tax=Zavarzinella formosa TaxID=360055 RepID=UPI0012F75375|nr:hypothetical protein [Zavarzinella formosa]
MATISTNKNGFRRILFVNANGERKSIYLGKVPAKTANEIRAKVESLASSNSSQSAIEKPTAIWVASIGDELADK